MTSSKTRVSELPSRVSITIQSFRSALTLLLLISSTALIGCRSQADAGRDSLIEAFKTRRLIEPRLSGGFRSGKFVRDATDRSGIDEDKRDRAASLIRDSAARGELRGELNYARLLLSENQKLTEADKYLRRVLKAEPEDTNARNDLGVCLMLNGRIEDAIDMFDGLLETRPDLPEALFNRGLCYERVGLKRAAESDFKRLSEIDRDPGWREEAISRQGASEGARASKSYQQFLEEFIPALHTDLSQAREFVDRYYENVRRYFFYELAPNYLRASDPDGEAAQGLRADVERVASLAVEVKEDRDMADTVTQMVGLLPVERPEMLSVLVDYRTALEPFDKRQWDAGREKLEQLDRRLNKPSDELFHMKVRYGIARAFYQTRRFTESIAILEGFLPLMRSRGWRYHLAYTQGLIGLNFSRLGQDSKALPYLNESYEEFRAMREPTGVPLQYLATTYWHLGMFDQALEQFRESTRVFLDQGRGDLANNYLTMADTYRLLNNHKLALMFADSAVASAEESKDFNRQAQATSFRAVEYGRKKQFDAAVGQMNTALELLQKLSPADHSYSAPLVLVRAGEVALQRGDYSEATNRYGEAEGLTSKAEGDPILHINALRGRADALARSGNPDGARTDLNAAIKIVEQYRQDLNQRLHRMEFLAASAGVFDQMIALDANDPKFAARAFLTSERARARSLLDEFTPRNREDNPTLGVKEIQGILPERMALLSYAVTAPGAHVFVLTRHNFEALKLTISESQLASMVDAYVSDIKKGASIDVLSKESRELYGILLQPVRSRLEDIDRLCIVPDKFISAVPLATLKDESDRYLIESFGLLYAPSAGVLAQCFGEASTTQGREERFVAIGNPSFSRDQFPKLEGLNDAANEARESAKFYNQRTVLLEQQATEPAVRQALQDCTVAHLASHCRVDQRSPWRSYLVLAPQPGAGLDTSNARGDTGVERSVVLPSSISSVSIDEPSDGLLYLNEVYNLKLPSAKLVVLSACDTGVGRYYGGEGIVSLIHPFLAAHVSTVVASLWPVQSNATSKLMIDFHRERRTLNLRSADALRNAQLEMIRDPEFNHPYLWGSFIVVGGDY